MPVQNLASLVFEKRFKTRPQVLKNKKIADDSRNAKFGAIAAIVMADCALLRSQIWPG
jgi:hypothetical protein